MVSIEKWRKSEDKSGGERKKHRVLLEFPRLLLQHPLQPPPLRPLFSFLSSLANNVNEKTYPRQLYQSPRTCSWFVLPLLWCHPIPQYCLKSRAARTPVKWTHRDSSDEGVVCVSKEAILVVEP